MPESSPESGDLTRPARSRWAWGAVIAFASLVWFIVGLPSEPHFVDESAYYSQTYYADLFFTGDWTNSAWLDYPAYDLPPLPKYLTGGMLALRTYKRPGPEEARRWYANTSSRFEPPGALTTARVPSALLGAAGCLAVYALGLQMRSIGTGVVAALLLMINPLYLSHARRAMSDVPAEAFLLIACALGLWVWTRALDGRTAAATWLAAALAGICGGLAVLCKLNGALAMIVMIGWAGLAWNLTEYARRGRLSATLAVLLAGEASLVTFLVLNPFLFTHPARPATPGAASLARLAPWERARLLVTHRFDVSRGQQKAFSHNALPAPRDKIAAVAVQGFGRFGPFGPAHDDSTRRYDRDQDWGALIWLPWVAAGAAWAYVHGRRQRQAGRPPTAWAILIQAAIALVVVTAYLPMAWNRYYLSLEAGAALLAAGVATAAAEWVFRTAQRTWRGA